jgi:hypothetical protein
MPAASGDAVQITRQGGSVAMESYDGKYLFYAKGTGTAISLWRMTASGGEEQLFLPSIENPNVYVVMPRGIYFISGHRTDGKYTLQFHDFASSRVRTVVQLAGSPGHGLSVTPDGTSALFCQSEGSEADIMLVDSFE